MSILASVLATLRAVSRIPILALLVALLGGSGPRLTAADGDARGSALRDLVRRGEYETAETELRARLEKAPTDASSRRLLADVLAARGRYDEALAVLEEADHAEASAALRTAQGRLHLTRGRLSEAEQTFRAALDLEPDRVEALYRLGVVRAWRGEAREAKRLWNRIVRVYQDLTVDEAEELPAETYVDMALALVRLNRFHDANDVMFPQAEEQDPKCPQLLLEWGRVFEMKYNFPEARSLFRDAFSQNPAFADARVAMANDYLTDFQVGIRRYSLAESQLEKALETNPQHAGAFAARGRLWLSDGDFGRARRDFETSLGICPADLETLGDLAATGILAADDALFQDAEKRALAVNPRPAVFYHTVAAAIEKRFRYAEAVEMAEKALELDPEYWAAYHTVGINCLRTGAETKGREYLQKSYENDPFNVWVVNTRKLLRHMDRSHRRIETERFRLSVPKADAGVLEHYLVPLLDEAFAKLSAHYREPLDTPLHFDVFSKHQWFSARIAGLGGFPATGACFGNVVALTTSKALPQNWGAVAWHEFAHVVTLHKTKHRVPRWLTEGLSVYEEGRDHPQWARNFSREIADAHHSARLLPLAELDFGFSKPKYPGQVLISYFQGCLVVQYINKIWGFDTILEVLDGYAKGETTPEIWKRVYSLELEEFDKGFLSWVDAWVDENGYRGRVAADHVPALEAAVELSPDDVGALVELAWGYHCAGNDVDAPLTARKALALSPECGDAHAILGFELLRAKKQEEAKAELLKALEKSTRYAFRVHRALGQLAARAKDTDGAVRELEAALAISPVAGATHPPRGNLYYQLADLYQKGGETEKAIERLEALRKWAPQDIGCRLRLAEHYEGQDTDEAASRAVDLLDEAIFINPFDPKIHVRLANLAERAGRHRVVIRENRYLLTLPDTNPRTAWLALARAHLALEKPEEAARCAREALSVDEECEEAREILERAGKGAAGPDA